MTRISVDRPVGNEHNNLSGLTTGDPHTQYALLAGRSGGQTLTGGTGSGGSLTLQSTSHATKGKILFGSNSAYDASINSLGIGLTNPSAGQLHIGGNTANLSSLDVNTTISTTSGLAGAAHFRNTITLNSASGNHQYMRAVPTYVPTEDFSGTFIILNNNVIFGDTNANSSNLTGNITGYLLRLTTQSGYTGTITRFFGTRIADSNFLGAASLTSQAGLRIDDMTAATNNTMLLLGNVNPPTGNWAIYGTSAKNSALTGNLRIGSTTAPTAALDVTGSAKISGTLAVGTPATYTTSNVTTDRTFDADATTTEELADVLGSLIADLKVIGLIS